MTLYHSSFPSVYNWSPRSGEYGGYDPVIKKDTDHSKSWTENRYTDDWMAWFSQGRCELQFFQAKLRNFNLLPTKYLYLQRNIRVYAGILLRQYSNAAAQFAKSIATCYINNKMNPPRDLSSEDHTLTSIFLLKFIWAPKCTTDLQQIVADAHQVHWIWMIQLPLCNFHLLVQTPRSIHVYTCQGLQHVLPNRMSHSYTICKYHSEVHKWDGWVQISNTVWKLHYSDDTDEPIKYTTQHANFQTYLLRTHHFKTLMYIKN
jgi:hypothetical protein